ncbi:MAG: hypothetical protein M3083_24785 [Actinomycetota bacterium]|nr:hypothetical protein [Actinomycetota bacterium]MDQ6946747.1 hypothetical protein [Actinomycetota bacterium]
MRASLEVGRVDRQRDGTKVRDEEVIAALVADAHNEGRLTEQHRQAMNHHAGRRQQIIRRLAVEHRLSVRGIASLLECSPAIVQKALRVANRQDTMDRG